MDRISITGIIAICTIVIVCMLGLSYETYSKSQVAKACIASSKQWVKVNGVSSAYECR